MTKRDCIIALALTILCGAMTLPFIGDMKAPETFWGTTEEKAYIMLDLGQEIKLDSIVYYAGLNTNESSEWILELSDDGTDWRRQPSMRHSIDFPDPFNWFIAMLEENTLPTRYIRITADSEGMELGELALFIRDEHNERVLLDKNSISEHHPQYAALIDEQIFVPSLPDMDNNTIFYTQHALISDNRSGMYFDEIFHARTAYEFIRGVEPTEDSHPPLGKVIISLGIGIFGMNPFGWRIMSFLFGLLLIPLIYVFIKNLFGNTVVAACGGILIAFENMRFTQSNTAMLETFLVFFILAMYLFMYRFISSGYDAPLKKMLLPLFLCGSSFGFAFAVKWSAFFAALGLVVLYVVYLAERRKRQIAEGKKAEFKTFLWHTLIASVVCFVAIPAIIYTLSYIPATLALGHQLTPGTLIRDMWENSLYILSYHSTYVVGTGHDYESSWWMWILNIRPILYFRRSVVDSGHILGLLNNPLVTVGGIVALWLTVVRFIRIRIWELLVIILGFSANLLPWIPVTRNSFNYHYLPSVVFLVVAICYVFNEMIKNRPESSKRVYLFCGVYIAVFLLLLPISAGIPVPEWYTFGFTRWLPTWLW